MSIDLTVIVKGVDGSLVKGATVAVSPGNITGKTNGDGEATVTINGASRYQVTVVVGGDSQTVPFYATSENTARLEVDLAYFKQLDQSTKKTTTTKAAATPTPWYETTEAFIGGGALLIIIIALVVIISAVRHAKRRKAMRRNVPGHGRGSLK